MRCPRCRSYIIANVSTRDGRMCVIFSCKCGRMSACVSAPTSCQSAVSDYFTMYDLALGRIVREAKGVKNHGKA